MRKIAILFFILHGCAHNHYFEQAGKTTHEFNQDWTDCQVKARQAGFVGTPRNQYMLFMDQCMSGRGWNRQKDRD